MTKEARKEARAKLAQEKKKALARRADNPEFALFITKIKKNYERLFRGYVKKMTSYRGMLAASTVHRERKRDILRNTPYVRACVCMLVCAAAAKYISAQPSMSLCLSVSVSMCLLCSLRTTARLSLSLSLSLSLICAHPPMCVCLSVSVSLCLGCSSLSGFPAPTPTPTPTPTDVWECMPARISAATNGPRTTSTMDTTRAK